MTQPVASKDFVGLVGLPRVHQNWGNLHKTAWLRLQALQLQATKLDMLWHSEIWSLDVSMGAYVVNWKTILVNSCKLWISDCCNMLKECLWLHVVFPHEAPAKMAQKFQHNMSFQLLQTPKSVIQSHSSHLLRGKARYSFYSLTVSAIEKSTSKSVNQTLSSFFTSFIINRC